jgi:hypothetical protein
METTILALDYSPSETAAKLFVIVFINYSTLAIKQMIKHAAPLKRGNKV